MVKNVSSALLAAALAMGLGAAEAATAHNSQAGSWGPTTHDCLPTPYFPAGGCASEAIADALRSPGDQPSAPFHPRRRLTPPTGPVPAPAY